MGAAALAAGCASQGATGLADQGAANNGTASEAAEQGLATGHACQTSNAVVVQALEGNDSLSG